VVHSYGTVADHPFGFAGQYTDAESELVYYGLRYYIPKHGRFINRDPIEEAGGNNLFAFVGNSPTNGWDMLGLTTICYDEGVLGTICVTNDGHIPNGATLIGGGTVRLDGTPISPAPPTPLIIAATAPHTNYIPIRTAGRIILPPLPPFRLTGSLQTVWRLVGPLLRIMDQVMRLYQTQEADGEM
jgi:RHS repeat-associated protein